MIDLRFAIVLTIDHLQIRYSDTDTKHTILRDSIGLVIQLQSTNLSMKTNLEIKTI